MARGGMMGQSVDFGSAMDEEDEDIAITMLSGSLSLEDRYTESDIFKKPGLLIYTDDEGLLTIDHKVLSQLSRIRSKVSVVGICGLYRTGKSYLMNWLAGENTGFALGNTIQSETRGIWLWCKDHPKDRNHVLLLVDTEGLDDPEKGDPDHDNKLFCLTLLISSTLIINVKGVFDYSALEKLAFIATLSDSIKILNHNDDDDDKESNARNIPVASPRLIMCIRDFYLNMEVKGKTLTPDQYLEDRLEISTKKGQEKFNNIKTSIQQYFPKRKCFTMAQPATGANLQNIEALPESSLDEQFVKDARYLREYVHARKPKSICNASKKPIDGADLACLITTYVNALRKDSPIQCETAYAQASAQRNERELRKVIKHFKKEMDAGRKLKSKLKLQDMFLGQYEQTLTEYRNKSFLYRQDYYEEEITDQMKVFKRAIEEEIKAKCHNKGKKILAKMYGDMLEKNQTKYMTVDGYAQYEADMSKLEENFELEMRMKGYDKDDILSVLDNFKKSVSDDKMKLYNAATGKLKQETYSKHRKDIESILNAQLDKAIRLELAKRNEYLKDELETLRKSYADLSAKLESKRMCIVM